MASASGKLGRSPERQLWAQSRHCLHRAAIVQAAVAVARRLAVTMHAMLKSGEMFDRTAGAAA